MTVEEVTFCNLVESYVHKSFGYFVIGLDRASMDVPYILRVKRLGDPDSCTKRFPVFADQLKSSVEMGRLPDSLLCDLPAWLK